MEKYRKFLAKIKPLARDLSILITGIMLSFLLNECRENRSDRNEEKRVMTQLIADLKADTTHLGVIRREMLEISNLAEVLFSDDGSDTTDVDELLEAIIGLATFSPFQPQRTALLELSFQNQNRNIRQGQLVSKTISLHEGTYTTLSKVTDLYSNYIVNQLIPFYTTKLPTNWYNRLNKSDAAAVRALMKSTEFRNHVNWMYLLQANIDIMYAETTVEAVDLLTEVEELY